MTKSIEQITATTEVRFFRRMQITTIKKTTMWMYRKKSTEEDIRKTNTEILFMKTFVNSLGKSFLIVLDLS